MVWLWLEVGGSTGIQILFKHKHFGIAPCWTEELANPIF